MSKDEQLNEQKEALEGILTKTLDLAKEMTSAQVSDEQAMELGVLMLRLTEEAQINMSERGVLFNLVELGRAAAEGDESLSDNACLEALIRTQREKLDLPLDLLKKMHKKAVEVHKYENLKKSWKVEPLELLEGIRTHNRTQIIGAVKAIAKELNWSPDKEDGIPYKDRVEKSLLLFKELLAVKEDSALFTEMMLDKDFRELIDKVLAIEQSEDVKLLEECRRLGRGINVLQKMNGGAFKILQQTITEEGGLEMDSAIIKGAIAELRKLPKEDAKLAIPAFFRMIADIKNPENKNSAIKAMGKTQDLKLGICATCHRGKADWLIRLVFPNDMKMLDAAEGPGITINKPFLQKITNWFYQRALSSAKNFNKPPIGTGWLFKRFRGLSEERQADILCVVEASKAAAILTAMDAPEKAATILTAMDAPEKAAAILTALTAMDAGVAAKIVGKMDDPKKAATILTAMDAPEKAAAILTALTAMDAGVAAKIVEKMDAGVAAKIVGKMDAEVAAKIVGKMDVSARFGIWNNISASAIVGILKEVDQEKQLDFLPEMRATKAATVLNEMPDKKKELLMQLLSINPRVTGNILGQMKSQEAVDFLLEVGATKTEDILYRMDGVGEFIGKMNPENAAKVLKGGSPLEVAEILVAVQKVRATKNVVEIVNRMDSGEVAAIFNTNTLGKFLKVESGNEKFRDLVLKELSEEKRDKVLGAMFKEKRESYLERMAPENIKARCLLNEEKTKKGLSKSIEDEQKEAVKDIREAMANKVRSANQEVYGTPPLRSSAIRNR